MVFKTTAVGFTRLIVNSVLVEVVVTRDGTTVFVGITVEAGTVVVIAAKVVLVTSVTRTELISLARSRVFI